MTELVITPEEAAAETEAPATPMPDFLSPVFVKELRQGLRAKRFVLPFVASQGLAVIAVGAELAITSSNDGTGGSDDFSAILQNAVQIILWFVIGVVMPLTSIGALRSELAGGRNVELLLMSNLDRWQIVLGKWMVGFALSGLMLVSLVPYLLTRYFVGGVDLIETISTLITVMLMNLAVTAIAIGASGFGNLIGRFMILGIGVLSGIGTWFGAAYPVLEKMTSGMGSSPAWSIAILILAGGLVAALYVAFGLQLARSRLRLFENPLDPPASGLVIALMIFTPIVVAVTSVATQGYGGVVAVIGLLVLALLIDRGPGKDASIRYAQP